MCDYSKWNAPPFQERKSGASSRNREISIQLWFGGSILESNKRSEGYTQIVMRGSGEIDLIAGFQTQTNRPKMPFETRARINPPAYIVRPQIIDRTREARNASRPWIEPEIDKSPLQRHERPYCSVARHEFGAKEPMQNFDIAVLEGNGSAVWIREALGESLLEVVAPLCFQHNMWKHFDARTCS